MRFALLHSPLVGASCWRAVVGDFAARGIWAAAPRLPAWGAAEPPYYPALAARVAEQIAQMHPVVLVVHSGAGSLAASVVASAKGGVSQVIFVDAILPHPGRTWFETASPVLGDSLRAKVTDGEVPAWDQWFPPGALAATLPEGETRERFVSELTPTPLAYLEETAPDLDLPDGVGWAYLRLSKAYEDEARVAREQGIPTLRLARHHLAMMTHADEVASALVNLVRGDHG
ncbi:MAG: hypothetical protein Q8N10_11935 [Phenylobacterium sp.]|uniref:alpha/beta fold hydrolase n=1 Tax=Phenylobacterium sp. TaxID=1871053 RepID=UPI002725FCED|nr:alpha/beta fold hydrolase [Phenylobacterium sp.]MDO8914260.1 hypothetical protein [Phenylobacterium sp.]MDP3101198.1 hypothetical protein [Phenylobacterium sp.]MDP3867953.1 hypothetical protein [Phenylobacterium sp.]HQT52618.1 hypothetical protein [Phenylobacterium sp.]